MTVINCPKCREENPAEAVMCWACYTPLGQNNRARPEMEPQAEVPLPFIEKLKGELSHKVPYLLSAGLISSGWFSRRARWRVLSASLVGWGSFFAVERWSQSKRAERDDGVDEGSVPPLVRIAQTIFYYALRENAEAIRLREDGRGMSVDYRIEDDWREQMKIPLFVWRPLRHLLLECARQGKAHNSRETGTLRLESDVPAFGVAALSADLRTDASGETLTLRFANNDAPQPAEEPLPLAPDARCAKCHEANAPGAAWCWNCYAPIEAPSMVPYIKEVATNVGIISAWLALVSSGWWPRRARPFVLGAGALGAATAFAWPSLQERFKDFKIEFPGRKTEKPDTIEMPVDVLVGQILARALKVRAAQIQLQERGNVALTFDGESRAGMSLPAYSWLALRGRLLELARDGFRDASRRRLSAKLRVDVSGEMLILRFDADV